MRSPLAGIRLTLLLLACWTMAVAASCNPPASKKVRADAPSDTAQVEAKLATPDTAQPRDSQPNAQVPVSTADAKLAAQFPLPEHLLREKELLLKHSQPATAPFGPDGKYLEGNFNRGKIELVLDEIDGEPSYFYGHRAEDETPVPLEFIAYGFSADELDALVPGQKYLVHWMETVVDMQPFEDARYRYFIAYRIDKGGK